MKYLKTYIPVILLVVYWLLFYWLKSILNDDYALYIVAIISLFTMIICAIKNNETVLQGIIMLIVYNIVDSIFLHIFSPSNSDSFLGGLSYSVMSFVFFGTSIIYFIIMFVRSLSQEKTKH